MWFTEDAWSPIILCVVIAAIFFIAYVQTQREKFLYPIGLVVLAAITIFFVEQVIVTDLEKIEERLKALVTTFVEESQSTNNGIIPTNVRCFDFFAEANTIDRDRVAKAIAVVSVEDDLRVPSIETTLSDSDSRAVTDFRANGTVSTEVAGGRHFATRWQMTWQKIGGEWKITETRMLDVVSGDPMTIPRVD